MAIKLASLFIELAANGDKLTAELKKSSKQTKTWQKNVDVSTKAVARSFKVVAAGAALGTTALTALYISNARSLDTLGKTAAKLGDTTEDLKVFGVAAQIGGVGVDQANTALQRMTRRLAEAAQGSGEAQGAIAELGLDAEALAAQRPSQAFEEIAAALDTVPLAADRVRLAMKFFDSEGVALVNVTTDALNEARRTVDAFGGALTSIEVAQVEAANDSITRLATGFDLITDKITVKLAGGVEEVAEQLFNSSQNVVQLERDFDNLLKGAIQGIGTVAGLTASMLRAIDGREEILEFGVIGLLLFGKKGAVLGALLGAVGSEMSQLYKETQVLLSDSSDELSKIEVQISKINKLINAGTVGAGGRFIGNREDYLETLIKERAELELQRDAIVSVAGVNNEAAPEEGGFLASLASILESAKTSSDTLLDNFGKIKEADPYKVKPFEVAGIDLNADAANDDDDGDKEKEKSFREKYIEEMLQTEEQFQQKWTAFQKGGSKERLAILYFETTGALETLSQHSRTMFELNKAVGLANATVFIATGISRALELPFPANLAAAATVALQGAAQIKTITSAKFGSGEVSSPTAAATTDVSSANSALAANDDSVTDSVAQSDSNNIVFFGFHTPGATDEQKADEQARLLQIAQDNDLLVRNSDGGFDYTGTGSSNYVSPEFEAVG